MPRKDDYATSVHISEKTLQEIEKAKKLFRKMEEDLNRKPENAAWRVKGNLKFDKDEIIFRALEEYNKGLNE